jgi:hypothetical protein
MNRSSGPRQTVNISQQDRLQSSDSHEQEKTRVMELERRGFLKAVTRGLALGCASFAVASGQPSGDSVTGELQTGSGTLHLEGRLKSGLLTLDAQEFLDRGDRSVIVQGRFGPTDLYSAMFSHQQDRTVFALFHDTDHSTTVVLSDSGDEKIGRLVLWNDNQAPQIYNLDKNKIMDTDSPKDIRDINGKTPDLVGNRRPSAFTWQELERVFESDPALLAFMRGRKATHHPHEENRISEWKCLLLSMVPGSTLCLFWLGK